MGWLLEGQGTTALLVLLAVSVVSTALGAYLCSRREFHVTTPRFAGGQWVFDAPFNMELTFRDEPDEGCACYCGEYVQEVRGLFEIYDGTVWHIAPQPTAADRPIFHAPPRSLRKE